MMLKHKFQRLLFDTRPTPTCAEISSNSMRELMTDCGLLPPKPPEKLPEGVRFMGVKVLVNNEITDGAMRIF